MRETRDPLCNNNTACVARTVVLRLFAFLSVTYTCKAKICNREKRVMIFIFQYNAIYKHHIFDDKYVAKYYCWFKSFLCLSLVFTTDQSFFKDCLLAVYEYAERWGIPRKVENKREWRKMSRDRRQENQVLTYKGNICKRVIDALERRLDKWRIVLLLFKWPQTCEWIFCSQKARRTPRDFHLRPSHVKLFRQSLKRKL